MKTRSLFFRVSTIAFASFFLVATCAIPNQAQARRTEGKTHTSVHKKRPNNNKDLQRKRDINRNTNVNRNINVNKNVNVNRNVNVRSDRRYYDGRHYYDYDRHHHHNDVGRALAIGALTGLVVGTVIASASMSPSCGTVYVNGYPYRQCGNTWYQPQYVGNEVNYIVVNPPR